MKIKPLHGCYWDRKLEKYSDPDVLKKKLETQQSILFYRIRFLFVSISKKEIPNPSMDPKMSGEMIDRFLAAVEKAGIFQFSHLYTETGFCISETPHLVIKSGNEDFTLKTLKLFDTLGPETIYTYKNIKCALKRHQNKVVELLLQKKPELEYVTGITATTQLHNACSQGNLAEALLALNNGGKLEYRVGFGLKRRTQRVLSLALENGHLEFLFKLLIKGKKVIKNHPNSLKHLLHQAALNKNCSLIKHLNLHYTLPLGAFVPVKLHDVFDELPTSKYTTFGDSFSFYCYHGLKDFVISILAKRKPSHKEINRGIKYANNNNHIDILEIILERISQDNPIKSDKKIIRKRFNALFDDSRNSEDVFDLFFETGLVKIDPQQDLSKFVKTCSPSLLYKVLNYDPSKKIGLLHSWEWSKIPLISAISNKRPENVQLLLDEGSDIMITASGGRTALSEAVLTGCIKTVQLVLLRFPKDKLENYLSKPETYNFTYFKHSPPIPMKIALKRGYGAIAVELIKAGSPYFTYINDRELLKDFYEKSNDPEILVNKVIYQEEISGFDLSTFFILTFLYACKYKHCSVVRLFIKHFGNQIHNFVDRAEIKEAFSNMLKNDMQAEVALFLNHIPEGKKAEFLNTPINGEYYLQTALESSSKLANKLLTEGANLSSYSFATCKKLLKTAMDQNAFDIAVLILTNISLMEKIEILQSEYGYYAKSALVYAVKRNSVQIARLLLKEGASKADVEKLDDYDFPKLLRSDSIDLIILILEICSYKKCIECIDSDHKEPILESYIRKKSTEIAELLINYGADVTKRCSDGKTLLEIAQELELTEIEKLIFNRLLKLYSQGSHIVKRRKISYPKFFYQVKSIGDTQINDRVFVSNEGKTFYVNSKFLSNRSDYFEILLDPDKPFKESKTDSIAIEKDNDTLESILEFIYTGKTEITYDNFKKLADASNEFLLHDLQRALKRWIMRRPECGHWIEKLNLPRYIEQNKPINNTNNLNVPAAAGRRKKCHQN